MSKAKVDPDRRIKRTRQMIREAFITLIKEKGFDSITVQEITERADINRSTFYFHYKDKFDLLDQSNDEMLQAFTAALQLRGDMPEQQCLYSGNASVSAHFEHIAANADFYKVMLGRNGVPCFVKRMKLAIEEAFYKKLSQTSPVHEQDLSIPREVLNRYVTSAHFGLIEWWIDHDLCYSPSYMATLLHQLVKLGPLHAAGILES